MTTFKYVGGELELFAAAEHWKRYLGHVLRGCLGRDVLEVGAGVGAATKLLATGLEERWLCLEPDPRLAAAIAERVGNGELPRCCEPREGVLADLTPGETFDTILYIDVLEHLERADEELACAADRLRPGGTLVVVSPAHQWLYSPFDRAVGHHRRYSASSLLATAPRSLTCVSVKYLDSAGLAASLGNRVLLRQSMPSRRQILFWDRFLVPLSRALDPLLGFRVGKSVMAAWIRRQ